MKINTSKITLLLGLCLYACTLLSQNKLTITYAYNHQLSSSSTSTFIFKNTYISPLTDYPGKGIKTKISNTFQETSMLQPIYGAGINVDNYKPISPIFNFKFGIGILYRSYKKIINSQPTTSELISLDTIDYLPPTNTGQGLGCDSIVFEGIQILDPKTQLIQLGFTSGLDVKLGKRLTLGLGFDARIPFLGYVNSIKQTSRTEDIGDKEVCFFMQTPTKDRTLNGFNNLKFGGTISISYRLLQNISIGSCFRWSFNDEYDQINDRFGSEVQFGKKLNPSEASIYVTMPLKLL